MKKTISISIASTLFSLEDDAYQSLDLYLKSVRVYFAKNPDHDEIIKDIESRIAEQFIDYTGGANITKDRIITIEHVEKLIASMGTVKDFAETDTEAHMNHENSQQGEHVNFENETQDAKNDEKSSEHQQTSEENKKTRKKLYRDKDNAMIAGVCSGVAAYFGIEMTFVRIIFLITLFFGGTGIIIYIILWIAMPEAVTAAQKLEMRGEPVTLSAIGEIVKEKVDEVKSKKNLNNSLTDSVGSFGKNLIDAVGKVFSFFSQKFFPLIGKIMHVLISIFVTLAMVSLVSFLIILSLNLHDSLFYFDLRNAVNSITYQSILTVSFILIVIPLIGLAKIGAWLGGRRKAIDPRLTGTLLTVWILALIAGIVTAISVTNQYEGYRDTQPWRPTNSARNRQQINQDDQSDRIQIENREQNQNGPDDLIRSEMDAMENDIRDLERDINF